MTRAGSPLKIVGQITPVRGLNYAVQVETKVVESKKTMFYGLGIAESGKIKFLFIYETPFEGWEP